MKLLRLRAVLPFVLIVTSVILVIVYVNWFAVDVPVADEWNLAPDLRALELAQTRFSDLWRLHNEHRLLFPRVVLLAVAWFSGWNTLAEMYVSFCLLLLILLFWWRMFRHIEPTGLWAFVPLAWLICSLGQWENLLTGWQLQFYLGVLAVLLAAERLSRGTWPSLCAAVACGVVASFSFSNGLLVWPAGLISLALMRAGRLQLTAWAACGALVIAAYFFDYRAPAGHASPADALSYPLETLGFFVLNVGAPLAGGDVRLAAVMGAYLLVLIAVCVLPTLKRFLWLAGPETALGMLVIVSVASSLAIAIGRVGFHELAWATSSRYVTISSIGLAALYLMLLAHSGGAHTAAMLVALMLTGVALSLAAGFEAGPIVYAKRQKLQYATQTFTRQPDAAFDSSVSAALIREHGPFLQARGWSVFRLPVSLVALSSYDEGLPVGEIVAGRPVVQHLKCPVSTLKDFQLLFGTYGRKNTSVVSVTLEEDSRVLTARSFSAAALEDNEWVTIFLPQPVERCAGRDLTMTISSADATPGNAVTIWSYPHYYQGTLVSPGDPRYEKRVLGLSLNVASETAGK